MVAQIAPGPGSELASGCVAGLNQVRDRDATAACGSGDFRKQHPRDSGATAAVTRGYCW